MRCAAAARPDRAGADHGDWKVAAAGKLIIFDPSSNVELAGKKRASFGHLPGDRSACAIRAALVGEIADQRIHGGIVRAADQSRRLPFLRAQAGIDQPLADDGTASSAAMPSFSWICPTGSPSSPARTRMR